jgi:hypothetical protein
MGFGGWLLPMKTKGGLDTYENPSPGKGTWRAWAQEYCIRADWHRQLAICPPGYGKSYWSWEAMQWPSYCLHSLDESAPYQVRDHIHNHVSLEVLADIMVSALMLSVCHPSILKT